MSSSQEKSRVVVVVANGAGYCASSQCLASCPEYDGLVPLYCLWAQCENIGQAGPLQLTQHRSKDLPSVGLNATERSDWYFRRNPP